MKKRLAYILLILADMLLAAYLFMAVTQFNKPDESQVVCNKVIITIEDASSNAFIDEEEVMTRMRNSGIYPRGRNYAEIDCRQIEEELLRTPFVRTVDCYKAQNGDVNVTLTQRMPVLRIKAESGADYYIDDNDSIMPKSDCTADLIVATGAITPHYAQSLLSPFTRALMKSDFARNLVVQIHVTPEQSLELVPRLASHIIHLGPLPEGDTHQETLALIQDFAQRKFDTLERFYRHGLTKMGWDLYSDISIEYDNQIICKRTEKENI